MRAFLSCALTHVPRELFDSYVTFIHALANELRRAGCEKVSYALIDSDPQLAQKPAEEKGRLCYVWDRELVRGADVLFAEVTYPSLGTGIELQIAADMGIPIVLCYERTAHHKAPPAEYQNPDHSRHALQIGEGYVSLMVLGLPTLFRAIGYDSPESAFSQVGEVVRVMAKDLGP